MFPIVYCTNIDVTNITIYEYITEHKKIQYYYDKIYTNLQHIITLIAKYKMSNNKLILSGIFVPLILNDTNTLYQQLVNWKSALSKIAHKNHKWYYPLYMIISLLNESLIIYQNNILIKNPLIQVFGNSNKFDKLQEIGNKLDDMFLYILQFSK